MHVMIKEYFTLFSFHPQCLNFKANIGISEMSSQLLRQIMNSRKYTLYVECSKKGVPPIINDPQKRALAGVGNPIKEVV